MVSYSVTTGRPGYGSAMSAATKVAADTRASRPSMWSGMGSILFWCSWLVEAVQSGVKNIDRAVETKPDVIVWPAVDAAR